MSWLKEPVPPSENYASPLITRVELVDHRSSAGKPGRVFSAFDVENVLVSVQDDGRTLKVFVS
ncbi:hypothetical protein THIBAULT_76 [Mycobacterium phage Thibault]|uniref:Uncharacterized protein n=1 Tax=Mycobacterium phage Thibault TaxID=1052673 RepID=G1FGE1_9CAUD|nr:hypothetical protein CL87_gp076 [Mycobacterium phage Thibault]AEJ94001.1 hypothetical protein THIBAULT_76 [Mycobacterium phage Thibault]